MHMVEPFVSENINMIYVQPIDQNYVQNETENNSLNFEINSQNDNCDFSYIIKEILLDSYTSNIIHQKNQK